MTRESSSRVRKTVGSPLSLAAGILLAAKPARADWGQGIDMILSVFLFYIVIVVFDLLVLALTRKNQSSASGNMQIFVALVRIVLGAPQIFLAILLPSLLVFDSGLKGLLLCLPMAPLALLGYYFVSPSIKVLKDRLPPAM